MKSLSIAEATARRRATSLKGGRPQVEPHEIQGAFFVGEEPDVRVSAQVGQVTGLDAPPEHVDGALFQRQNGHVRVP